MTRNYEEPKLTQHGSVSSLTMNGKPGSDVDGASGMLTPGNASMSDTTGDGSNAGGGPAMNMM